MVKFKHTDPAVRSYSSEVIVDGEKHILKCDDKGIVTAPDVLADMLLARKDLMFMQAIEDIPDPEKTEESAESEETPPEETPEAEESVESPQGNTKKPKGKGGKSAKK